MYFITLTVHSWVRWLLIGVLLVVVGRALWAWRRHLPWTSQDRKMLVWLLGLADIQLLLGILLTAFFSPRTSRLFREGSKALEDAATAYWIMEHAVPMILAVFLIHVGHVFVRRGQNDLTRHRRALLFFGIATIIILTSTPWPFTPYGRPLFRLG